MSPYDERDTAEIRMMRAITELNHRDGVLKMGLVREARWAWGQHHRQLDPTGWKRMDKGELVHHPDCPEQRATKKGLGIPPS